MARIGANIGDIVEIETESGLGYVQCTHIGGNHGELVRVLPGLYRERLADFTALSRQHELYFAFYTLTYAIREGRALVVSSQPVPEWARSYPMMRLSVSRDDTGKTTQWRIITAESRLTPDDLARAPVINQLSSEQEKLSIREIWPHEVMVRRLSLGWTPENSEELRLKDQIEKAQKSVGGCADDTMWQFLYFPAKGNAMRVGEVLRSRGFSVEVRRAPGGDSWLTLANRVAPSSAGEMDVLRSEMEALAALHEGEYDGWETRSGNVGFRGRGGDSLHNPRR
jgi:hypothetical protein